MSPRSPKKIPIAFLRLRASTLAASLILLAALVPASAMAEKVEQLQPQGYVNDFAGVLDSEAKARLTVLAGELDQKAHAQIAVVTIHSLDGVPIEDFANLLFQRWGIGPKSGNRGVLILLAVDDHKYRVEVGYGLEPVLPDGKVGGFGRAIVPELRQSEYSGALLHLTAAIAQVIAADRGVTLANTLPEERTRRQGSQPGFGGTSAIVVLALLAFFVFGGLRLFLPPIFASRRGRFRRGWWGSPWMGGGPWIGGSWGGGGHFGGFGGGGGFGGFGGGISGGGGASGSW